MAPAPPNAYPPGTHLTVGSHQVTIERYLSEGGFAHVYVVKVEPQIKGVETACLKRVAVPNKAYLNLLRAEVEAMQRLKDKPNVVQYFDSHAERAKSGVGYEVFVLMEFCAGGGLIDFMNTRLRDQLKEHEVLKIMRDITLGLAQMHYLRPPLIHKDLKIENVLLTGDGMYKLCDFGSAGPVLRVPKTPQEFKILEEDIQHHTTVQYRAPEMIDLYLGYPIDEKSDIWALGVFLYKLCYYTTPFERGGNQAILTASFSFPPRPKYSDRLKNMIRVLLQPVPTQRPNVYQVMQEICDMRGEDNPLVDIYHQSASQRVIPAPLATSSSHLNMPGLVPGVAAPGYPVTSSQAPMVAMSYPMMASVPQAPTQSVAGLPVQPVRSVQGVAGVPKMPAAAGMPGVPGVPATAVVQGVKTAQPVGISGSYEDLGRIAPPIAPKPQSLEAGVAAQQRCAINPEEHPPPMPRRPMGKAATPSAHAGAAVSQQPARPKSVFVAGIAPSPKQHRASHSHSEPESDFIDEVDFDSAWTRFPSMDELAKATPLVELPVRSAVSPVSPREWRARSNPESQVQKEPEVMAASRTAPEPGPKPAKPAAAVTKRKDIEELRRNIDGVRRSIEEARRNADGAAHQEQSTDKQRELRRKFERRVEEKRREYESDKERQYTERAAVAQLAGSKSTKSSGARASTSTKSLSRLLSNLDDQSTTVMLESENQIDSSVDFLRSLDNNRPRRHSSVSRPAHLFGRKHREKEWERVKEREREWQRLQERPRSFGDAIEDDLYDDNNADSGPSLPTRPPAKPAAKLKERPPAPVKLKPKEKPPSKPASPTSKPGGSVRLASGEHEHEHKHRPEKPAGEHEKALAKRGSAGSASGGENVPRVSRVPRTPALGLESPRAPGSGGSGGSPFQPSNKIQQRVHAYLNGQDTVVRRTARGYGRHTDAAAAASEQSSDDNLSDAEP